MNKHITSIIIAAGIISPCISHAGTSVIGGSGILTLSGAAQLAVFLGEGDLDLFNILTRTTGVTRRQRNSVQRV